MDVVVANEIDENLYLFFLELIFIQPTYLIITIIASLIIIAVAITKSTRAFIFYNQQKKELDIFVDKFWSGVNLNELDTEIGDKKKYIKQKSVIEDIFIAGMYEIKRFQNNEENKNLMPGASQMKIALRIALQKALWKIIEIKKWFYNFYIIFLVLYILTILNSVTELPNIFKTNPAENIFILFPLVFTTVLYLCYTCLFYICGRFHTSLEYKLISFCDDFLLIVERNSKSTLEDE
jgi:predicted neutral ceramidase superfamily lipid hydrolase